MIDELQYCCHVNGKNADGSKVYWTCVSRHPPYLCKARLHTLSRDYDYSIVKRINEHNHETTKSGVEVKKGIIELKDRCVYSNYTASTRELASSCVENFDCSARADFFL